uniref:Peptidase S1 domain-containing protein n=1 Tax=Anopheles maculatus TaxID=74869 RepID=A0A182S9D3_9DIPT
MVYVGRIHLEEEDEFTQKHSVREIVVHPGFSRNSIMNDITILKLATNITMTKYVQPVCLWTMDSNQELIVGRNGTIVGFGLNEDDVVSNQLKQALIGVVDALTCIASDRSVFGTHLTSDIYCGRGQMGVSACNGDSGGGMFFEVGGKWFPVCLWTMDSNQEMIVGRNGTIVGFGLNEDDVVSKQLKQALIGVVDALTCIASDRSVFGTHLTSDMYCAKGQTGVSACNGDSGGGMFFEVGGKWFIRGLVSFTPLRGNTSICDPLKYTAYTDVAKYLKWITQYVDNRVLTFETDVLEIDYEEKLRLFNFNTCGVKSSTFVRDGSSWTLPWLGFVRASNEYYSRCVVTLISEWYAVGPALCFENDGVE